MTEPKDEPLTAESHTSFIQVELQSTLDDDPLVQEAIRLGGVVTEIEPSDRNAAAATLSALELQPFAPTIFDYLDTVHIITADQKLFTLRAELLTLLQASPARLENWLLDNRMVFPGCESEVAAKI